MTPVAYYNEFDPYAAAWLMNLINAGVIAPGVVDTRSIEDVTPNDLTGFTQCHFFAGIGVWSCALRAAGWPDNRPVWTASCPCQPFSAAGEGAGFADQRHLWPAFYHLVTECRPPKIYGEQVASSLTGAWFDLVHADMEAMGYAFGCIPSPSAGVGAPHIRDRAYWMADALRGGSKDAMQFYRDGESQDRFGQTSESGSYSSPSRVVGVGHAGLERRLRMSERGDGFSVGAGGLARGLADVQSIGREGQYLPASGGLSTVGSSDSSSPMRSGQTNGYWRDADWLGCTDGKWRPVSPKPQPMADGSAESLGRVCASTIAQIEREINAWSMETKVDGSSAMRDLQKHLGTESQFIWSTGRLPRLHEAPFLLAFLRQLAEQGWRFSERPSVPGAQTFETDMRMLRDNGSAPSASREHGLARQQPNERSDTLHFLSSLLARHAHTAWDNSYSTYAEIGFPLAGKSYSRTGRLKGYGNAINMHAAAAFIRATLTA